MPNVIAINAAAKKHIADARATSDEMLLESIAKGDRTAMHVLYSRHHVRVYRFVLRIVRDTTMAEDLVSQVFLDVWRTAKPVRRPLAGFDLAAVDRPLQGADRAAPAQAMKTSIRTTCWRSPTNPIRRRLRSTAPTPARSCAPASPSCRRRTARSSISSTTTRRAWKRPAQIIGIPQSTVKTRMFYARKQLAELLKVAGVESLAA